MLFRLGPGAALAQPALQLVEPGSLTVGTYGTVIPGIVVDPGDKLGGLDGVLLTAFAKDHGLELKLYQTTVSRAVIYTLKSFPYNGPQSRRNRAGAGDAAGPDPVRRADLGP